MVFIMSRSTSSAIDHQRDNGRRYHSVISFVGQPIEPFHIRPALNPAVNDVGLNKLAGETHLSRYEPSAIAHGNYRCHVNSAIGYKQTVSRYRTPTTFFPDSDQGGSLLDDTNSSWEDRIDAAIESDLTPSSITLPYDIFKPTVSIFESLDLPPIDPAFDLLANISGQGTHSNASNDCQEPYADNQAKHNHRPNDERFDMPNLSLQHPAQTHQALERDCLHLPQNHQDAQHRIKARHAIDIQHVNDMLSDLEVHSKDFPMAELSMLADQSGTTVEFGMSEASLAVNYGVINPSIHVESDSLDSQEDMSSLIVPDHYPAWGIDSPLSSGLAASQTPSPVWSNGSSSASRFVCHYPRCRSTFGRRSDRDRHARKHDIDIEFLCPHSRCTKKFYRNDKLEDHLKKGHSA